MERVSASEAKLHFGALIDSAQRGPVTIERQGRPVAVVISFETYTEQVGKQPARKESKEALRFLSKWANLPAPENVEKALEGDMRGALIWDKYTKKA